jgi:TPR repeat protein
MNLTIPEIYARGMEYDQEGNPEAAIECFEQVMTMCDKYSEFYRSSRHNIACKLIELGNDEIGMKLLEESANDNYPSSLYYMGVAYEKQNDIRGISCYRKAAKMGNVDAIAALNDLRIPFEFHFDNPIKF